MRRLLQSASVHAINQFPRLFITLYLRRFYIPSSGRIPLSGSNYFCLKINEPQLAKFRYIKMTIYYLVYS